jgi:hypothetical protein
VDSVRLVPGGKVAVDAEVKAHHVGLLDAALVDCDDVEVVGQLGADRVPHQRVLGAPVHEHQRFTRSVPAVEEVSVAVHDATAVPVLEAHCQVCQPPVAGTLMFPDRLAPEEQAMCRPSVTPFGEASRKVTV